MWETGKFANRPETNLETWFIRGGSAGAALYTFKQPGLYAYVTHNLIEAVELGATAHFKVEGKWNDDLMTQVKAPAADRPEGRSAVQAAPGNGKTLTENDAAGSIAGRVSRRLRCATVLCS